MAAWGQDRFEGFNNLDDGFNDRFAGLKEQIEERWTRFKESTVPQWVNYSEDFKAETVVEFEKGYVEVSVLVEEGTDAQARLREELKQLSAYQPSEQTGSLLDDQIEFEGQTLDAQGIEQNWSQIEPLVLEIPVEEDLPEPEAAEQDRLSPSRFEQVSTIQVTTTPPTTVRPAKAQRTKKVLRLPLTPQHLRKRAIKFLPLVRKYCQEFGLKPELVLALMQSESWFNPNAKSHANAHGLMQLVPTSGARDAYKRRYGKDKIVSPEYLYDPENNIELGTQYLWILRRQFHKAQSENKIDYLAISAYNTGAGNVSRALGGTTNLSRTLHKVHDFTDQGLYDYLIVNLPYEETQGYLRKIVERMPLYKEL